MKNNPKKKKIPNENQKRTSIKDQDFQFKNIKKPWRIVGIRRELHKIDPPNELIYLGKKVSLNLVSSLYVLFLRGLDFRAMGYERKYGRILIQFQTDALATLFRIF